MSCKRLSFLDDSFFIFCEVAFGNSVRNANFDGIFWLYRKIVRLFNFLLIKTLTNVIRFRTKKEFKNVSASSWFG